MKKRKVNNLTFKGNIVTQCVQYHSFIKAKRVGVGNTKVES